MIFILLFLKNHFKKKIFILIKKYLGLVRKAISYVIFDGSLGQQPADVIASNKP